MKQLIPLTHARLLTVLNYDPVSGIFTWKVSPANNAKVGQQAGAYGQGYIRLSVDRKSYLAHRLAWFYVYGVWPTLIDHKDGDGTNNAISNLREATHSQNMANQAAQRHNKLGVKGVQRARRKYRARIRVAGVQWTIGVFDTVEEAAAAHDATAKKYYGEFAHN